MLDRIRYFFEDLSATALVVIGSVLGLAVGVVVTTQLTGTPSSSTDLDRAAAASLHEESTTAVDQPTTSVSDDDVTRLEDKVADQRALLLQERTVTQEQQDELDRLTEALDRLRGQRADLRNQLTELEDAPTSATVSGVLLTSSTFVEDEKPWPSSCASAAAQFQVKVTSGGGTDFIAQATDSEVVQREVTEDVLTLACRFAYQATLPLPLATSYNFSAVATVAAGTSLDTAPATAAQLEQGKAPKLSAVS